MTGSGWTGESATTDLPPPAYWEHLAVAFPDEPVAALRQLSDQRLNEFTVGKLPPPQHPRLLDALATDGWLEKSERRACANSLCNFEPMDDDVPGNCPDCDTPLSDENTRKAVYRRALRTTRDVDWVVVVHGMNTTGAWQEEFSWFLGTTWGRSVPVAIYKYGIILTGVLRPWKRRKLQRELRARLAELRKQARDAGYGAVPDVVAHSFGTWLLGHLLEDELKPGVEDPLKFGRVILAGCILRPDYDWAAIKDAGLVEQVLNHYATKDPVVPLAHWTIWDSGPSGRRGFDGDDVINVRAVGLKHSDLFSVDLCVENDLWRRTCPTNPRGNRHLDRTYSTYWKPFLTLPDEELCGVPDIAPPARQWRQGPSPLRGTLFPLVVLPVAVALLAVVVGWIGEPLSGVMSVLRMILLAGIGALVLLALCVLATLFAQRFQARDAAP